MLQQMQNQTHTKNAFEAKVFTKGTIKLPATIRNELNIHDGDKVLFIRKNDSWIVTTHLSNIRKTQEYIELLNKKKVSLVDELIVERRREAVKEEIK